MVIAKPTTSNLSWLQALKQQLVPKCNLLWHTNRAQGLSSISMCVFGCCTWLLAEHHVKCAMHLRKDIPKARCRLGPRREDVPSSCALLAVPGMASESSLELGLALKSNALQSTRTTINVDNKLICNKSMWRIVAHRPYWMPSNGRYVASSGSITLCKSNCWSHAAKPQSQPISQQHRHLRHTNHLSSVLSMTCRSWTA